MFENPLVVLWVGALIAFLVWILLSFSSNKNLSAVGKNRNNDVTTSALPRNNFTVTNGFRFGFGFGIGVFLSWFIIGVAGVLIFGATVAAFLQNLGSIIVGF